MWATLMDHYLTLLRVEFTMLQAVTSRTVRSYRTLSPLPVKFYIKLDIGGLLSAELVVNYRSRSNPPGVTWHSALWSPDFPLLYKNKAAIVWSIRR